MAGASLRRRGLLPVPRASCGVVALLWPAGRGAAHAQGDPHRPAGPVSFQTGAECMACHNGLITPSRRGRLDWRELARLDDGALLAGPVLAGRRPPRSDRSSGACRGDRGRVLHLPHADDHLSRPRRRGTRQGVRTPSHRRAAVRIRWQPTACRAPCAIRSRTSGSGRPRASPAGTSSTSPVRPARSRCSDRSRSMMAGRT